MIPKMSLNGMMNPGMPNQMTDLAAFAQMAQANPDGVAKMLAASGQAPPPVESVVPAKSVGALTNGNASSNLITRTPLEPPPGAKGVAETPAPLSTPVGQDAASQAAAGANSGGGGLDPQTQAMLTALQSIKQPDAPAPPPITPGAGITPGRPGDPSSIQNAIALALGGKANLPQSLGQLINGR